MADDGSSPLLLSASVPLGLEHTAIDECVEVLGVTPSKDRGRITFEIDSMKQLHKVLIFILSHNYMSLIKVVLLRSIEKFHIVITEIKSIAEDEVTYKSNYYIH